MPWDGVDFFALTSVDSATWRLILVGLAGAAAAIGGAWHLSAFDRDKLRGQLLAFLCSDGPLMEACSEGRFPKVEIMVYAAGHARALRRACLECAASNLGVSGLDLDALPCEGCRRGSLGPAAGGMADLMDLLGVVLTPFERRVVELHDLLDETYPEIAGEIHHSPDSCRMAHTRAILKLRGFLETKSL